MTSTQSSLTRVRQARDSGYTDEQITEAFNEKYGDRIQKARDSGYSDDDIFKALEGGSKETKQTGQVATPTTEKESDSPFSLKEFHGNILNRDTFIRHREHSLNKAKESGQIDDPTYSKYKDYLRKEDRLVNFYPNWAIGKDLRRDMLKQDINSGLLNEEQAELITQHLDNEPSATVDTLKGIMSGLTLGISEKFIGGPELGIGKIGQIEGGLLNFLGAEGLIAKGLTKAGVDQMPKVVQALARATGIGGYGATAKVIEHTVEEGELPSVADVAKHGAGWFALDLGLQALSGAVSKFRGMIEDFAKAKGWTKSEALINLMEQGEKAGISLPEAPITKENIGEVEKFIDFAEKETGQVAKSVDDAVLDKISFDAPEKAAVKESGIGDTFMTEMVDEFHPLKKRVEAYESATGVKLPAEEDPYTLARLLKGSDGTSEAFLKYGTRSFKTGEEVGPSLKEVLKPVRDSQKEFSGYLTSKRALEYHGMGKNPAGITKEEAEKYIAKYSDEFEPVYKNYRKYRSDVNNYLKDSGMLSEEQLKNWEEFQKDHVSFYRVFEDVEPVSAGKSKGIEPRQPIKKLKGGGDQTIIDPLESDVSNTYAMIEAANKNNAVKKLADFLEKQAPEATSKTASKAKPTRGNAEKVLEDSSFSGMIEGDKAKVSELEELSTRFEKDAFQPGKNQIAYWENGERQLVEVPPDVASIVKGMNSEEVANWIKIASIPSKILRGTVVLDPVFQTRLFLKDQMEAGVYSKYGFIPVLDTARGMGEWVVGGKNYRDWLASGGGLATRRAVDRFGARSQLKELTETKLGKFGRVIKNPLELTGMFSELLEESTRIGEFSKGVSKGASPQEAALQARNITLDYARIGAKTRGLNSLSQFFNAKVQGWDKIMKDLLPVKVSGGKIQMKPENYGATLKAAAGLTLPGMYLWYANKDDERYQELPDYVKDNNIVILSEDKSKPPNLIPLPFELGQFFYRLPQTIMENLYDTKYKRRIDKFFIDQAQDLLPAVPAIATPVLEAFSNRDPFTGNKIVPDRLKNVERVQQETEYTSPTVSKLAQLISKIPGIPGLTDEHPFEDTPLASPLMLEKFIKAWTGGLGDKAVKATDATLRKLGVVEDRRPAGKPSDDPIFGYMTARYPSAYSRSVEEVYNIADEQETLHKSMKNAREKKDLSTLSRLNKEYRVDPRVPRRMTKALSSLNKRARMIQRIPADKITPEERAKLLDDIYIQMTQMSRSWVENYRKQEKKHAK